MTKFLVAVAAVAAIGTAALPAASSPNTAEGFDVLNQTTVANQQSVIQASRDRIRTRLHKRIHVLHGRVHELHHRILELRPDPAPVASSSTSSTSTSTSTGTSSASYSTASSGSLYISEAQAADAMRAAGFPESAIAWFNNGIIDRESNYCPTAVYPGHCGDVSLFVPGGNACSLFQLFHCPGPQAADPYVAARYAYSKYQSSGYSPWGG